MIQIDNNGEWWIDKDEYCFIVKRKIVTKTGKQVGREYYTDETYHATHEQVINKIADLALGKAINHDLVGMVELIEGFKHKFNELKAYKR